MALRSRIRRAGRAGTSGLRETAAAAAAMNSNLPCECWSKELTRESGDDVVGRERRAGFSTAAPKGGSDRGEGQWSLAGRWPAPCEHLTGVL